MIFLILLTLSLNSTSQDEGSAILQKHFEASGQELWDQINNVTVDGRWVDEKYYGHKMKLIFKDPNRIRIEGKFNNKTFIEAYNGTTGWIVAPWKKKYEVQEMSKEEDLLIRNSFSLGSPLARHKDQLKFMGLDAFEGDVYYTFAYEDDQVNKTFYVGRNDHHLYYEKITAKSTGREILKVYEKYRTYSGLSMPTAVRFEGEGLEKELVFDEVYLGMGANNSLFEVPRGQ